MAWSREDFRTRYNRLAPFYDPGLWLYRLAGLRLERYRREAVAALELRPGDTVVDLGCGTGLNFPLLQEAVTVHGRIIGVDISPGMLAQADKRIQRAGWENVQLIEADMSSYRFPADIAGVISTLALATVSDYDTIIKQAATALAPAGRIANVELQWPSRWPTWLARTASWLNRPAGVTPDIVNRRPADAIERYFPRVGCSEVYFGAVYICNGGYG